MASKSFCDTCLRRDNTSPASKYCSDCEDALCAECVNVHNTIRALASHHVVEINLAATETYAVYKHCSRHREMILELYCNEHDTLCCRSCMATDHRTCEKLIPIEVVAKNVKSSALFEDASLDVEQLIQISSQLSDEKNKRKIDLKKSKEIAKKKILNVKEELLKTINEMENKCMLEIETVYSDLSKQVDKENQRIQMQIQSIREIKNQFEFTTNHGSDSQIFRLLHSIKSDIRKVSTDLEEFIPSLRLRTVIIEDTDLLPLIKALPSVTVKANQCKISYKSVKSKQAQMLQPRERVLTRLELETEVTVTGGGITGICFTTDGRLILCKCVGSCLLVLTEKGQYIQKISLPASPWGIAIEPGSDEAWCTMPSQNYVQIIDTKTYKVNRQVNLSRGEYQGISFVDDQIALGGFGKIDIIDKQGVVTKSLSIGVSNIHSISAAGKLKLYCCQADDGILHYTDLDGSSIFTYSSEELGGPIDVKQDSSGNLYVVSYNMHNLHKISPSGKSMDIMLKQENGLCSPRCLCFSRDYSKLFIPNYDNNQLLIFQCIYTPAI